MIYNTTICQHFKCIIIKICIFWMLKWHTDANVSAMHTYFTLITCPLTRQHFVLFDFIWCCYKWYRLYQYMNVGTYFDELTWFCDFERHRGVKWITKIKRGDFRRKFSEARKSHKIWVYRDRIYWVCSWAMWFSATLLTPLAISVDLYIVKPDHPMTRPQNKKKIKTKTPWNGKYILTNFMT